MADDLDAADLVAAARQHDEAAAREMVRRLYPLVLKLVRRIVRAGPRRRIFAR